MPIADTNTPSRRPGPSILVQIAMAGACIGLLVASVMKFREQESAHDKVRAVIEEKVLARGGLEACSVLFGTQRHEGKCGAFGKYTVLSGGSDLYVFEGPTHDNPRMVAGQTVWGFRATEELQEYALGR